MFVNLDNHDKIPIGNSVNNQFSEQQYGCYIELSIGYHIIFENKEF